MNGGAPTGRGPDHRTVRHALAGTVFALAGALTLAAVAALAWAGFTLVDQVWSYALSRIAAAD
ncbi:hypothetical protein [Nocardiopsis algeriensis]|uniref:Uncharacterized protein n=1 Tax=Nocardiopsis algeriensis TaxID=1478215 RepID=A0A841IQY1_9ACTN|nr:hypothetical protein [Nocardiopsis algeriensis]MBB6120624.1 hypothetical protein [Nocardiopsis algeriensis]